MSAEVFHNYLKSQKNINQKQLPFYMVWVREFIRFCKLQENAAIPEKLIDPFLIKLGRRHEQWQVDQAREALNLYCYFLSRDDCGPGNKETVSIEDWKSAGDMMIRMLRLKQRSYRTEQTYMKWLRSFYVYVKPASPCELSDFHIKNFLSYLAVDHHVAKSTRNQAFNAILFFFRHVLEKQVGSIQSVVRAKRGQRLPSVLTQVEVKQLISSLQGTSALMVKMIYGGGLRLNECTRLRIKDLDFERSTVTVREGKGDKDRQTLLPCNVAKELKSHLEQVRLIYEADHKADVAGVHLPGALDKKYPSASKQWIWFWVFPSDRLSVDPRTNLIRRHHVSPDLIQRAIKKAAEVAQSPNGFRRIRFGTVLQLTYWKMVMIFERFRCCWGIPIYKRP
jgi:integron integrase